MAEIPCPFEPRRGAAGSWLDEVREPAGQTVPVPIPPRERWGPALGPGDVVHVERLPGAGVVLGGSPYQHETTAETSARVETHGRVETFGFSQSCPAPPFVGLSLGDNDSWTGPRLADCLARGGFDPFDTTRCHCHTDAAGVKHTYFACPEHGAEAKARMDAQTPLDRALAFAALRRGDTSKAHAELTGMRAELAALRTENDSLRRERDALVKAQRDWREGR